MTEQIDKLIKTVGTDTSGKWMRIDQVYELTKLVVQDCAGVGYDASYFECASNVSNKIKERFGLE